VVVELSAASLSAGWPASLSVSSDEQAIAVTPKMVTARVPRPMSVRNRRRPSRCRTGGGRSGSTSSREPAW
jgi:hypothetical protein